jgi:membrane protein
VRLIAIGLTIALSLLMIVAFTLIVAGPQLADLAARYLAFGSVFVWTWKMVQWPIAFALVAVGIGLIYYVAPDAEQFWVWITPGSLAATSLWLIGSLAFRFYAVNFGDYEATYGALGGVILLLLWFYLSGLVIVIGAEMNAEIEHASPWGKAPGEKVPGQRKKIGAAAARAYDQGTSRVRSLDRQRAAPTTPVGLDDAPSLLDKIAAFIVVLIRWRKRT